MLWLYFYLLRSQFCCPCPCQCPTR
jgi:hypothetical protein